MKAYLKHIIAPGFLRKCRDCRGDGFLACDVCAESKPRSAFTESQLRHKGEPLRQFTCLDCAHPACSVKGCLTCKSCRDPDCKMKDICNSAPIPLGNQMYPKNLAEKLSFQCRSCRLSCAVCGERDRSKFSASMLHHERKHFASIAPAQLAQPRIV